MVRNICFESNRALRKYAKRQGDEILGLIERLRMLRSEYPRISAIPRQLAKIFKALRDNDTAIAEAKEALAINETDISVLNMLGRYLHDDRDYLGAIAIYARIRDLNGWDPKFTDLNTARYSYNGYLLALMYSGDYSRIIDETHNWSTESPLRDLTGAFRARAWKRSVEVCGDNELRAKSLNRATSILDELHKLYGYPEWSLGFFGEVIRGIDDSFRASEFSATKNSNKLLSFADYHMTNVFKDEGDDLEAVLAIAANFSAITLDGNPFRSTDWINFLKTKGGHSYADSNYRASMVASGFIFAKVYHIPRPDGAFIFAQDENNGQYFIHFESVTASSRHLWRRIKDGMEVAVMKDDKPPVPNKAFRSIETILL